MLEASLQMSAWTSAAFLPMSARNVCSLAVIGVLERVEECGDQYPYISTDLSYSFGGLPLNVVVLIAKSFDKDGHSGLSIATKASKYFRAPLSHRRLFILQALREGGDRGSRIGSDIAESEGCKLANLFVLIFHRSGQGGHCWLCSFYITLAASGHVAQCQSAGDALIGIRVAQVFDQSSDDRINRFLRPAFS